MKYLQLAIQEPAESRNPMHTFLMENEEVHLAQLWNWNETAGVDLILFRVVGNLAVYTSALEEVDFIADYETARIDSESFYVCIEHETRVEDTALRAPLQRPVLAIPPIEFAPSGEINIDLVGSAPEMQAAIDEFPSTFEIRIDQIGTYEQGVDAFSSLLTERQKEAVSIAVKVGYYDVPRSATIETVAQQLGCASSTASKHLQKAQARLAQQVVE